VVQACEIIGMLNQFTGGLVLHFL